MSVCDRNSILISMISWHRRHGRYVLTSLHNSELVVCLFLVFVPVLPLFLSVELLLETKGEKERRSSFGGVAGLVL